MKNKVINVIIMYIFKIVGKTNFDGKLIYK